MGTIKELALLASRPGLYASDEAHQQHQQGGSSYAAKRWMEVLAHPKGSSPADAEKSSRDSLTLETQTDEQIKAGAAAAKTKAEIQKRQDKKLTGGTGDLTADMFGEGDSPLFNERRDGFGSSPTPADDAAYLKAAEDGDMERRNGWWMRREASGV